MAGKTYKLLPLTSEGEGHVTFSLDNAIVELVTRFNYTIGAWSLDILDVNGNMLVAGIMMFPGFDLLAPYVDLKELIGGLMLVEQHPGDHTAPDLLGYTVQLLWFPVGTPVVFP